MKQLQIITIVTIALLIGNQSVAQFDIDRFSQELGVLPNDFVAVTVAGNPRIIATTNTDSPRLVLVEFSDVNCGYCIRFHKNTLQGILTDFVDTGKIDYVYKDYVSIGGPQSENVALALRCLHSETGNDTYFDILEKLYATPGRLGLERLFEIMTANLVNTQVLSEAAVTNIRECIESKAFFDAYSFERMEAEAIGVVGTPIFLLGVETQEGRVEGVLLPGYLQYEVLAENVEKMQAALQWGIHFSPKG